MTTNSYIPRSIIKVHDGVKYKYTLTQVKPSCGEATQIKLSDNEALFEKIIEKYFVFGADERCLRVHIQQLLRGHSQIDEDIQAVGFDVKSDTMDLCPKYRAFIRYLLHLKGVEGTILENPPAWGVGFKGIGIR